MRNPERWRPTKFVLHGRRLRASRDEKELLPSSRFVADILAARYQALLEAHARGRLLDLGAGHVPLYAAYRDLVDSVACVDWESSEHPCEHLDLHADLNAPLPLPDAAYDTVLLTDVLEHVYKPLALFGEIGRVLAPGGKLLLGVPFFYWIHEAPHDYARYTEFTLRRFCADSGLRVVLLEPTGGSPEIVLDLVGKHLVRSAPLAKLHGSVAGWVLRLPGVAALSRHSARRFPQGYVLVAEKEAAPPVHAMG